jgi:hypothetical protein
VTDPLARARRRLNPSARLRAIEEALARGDRDEAFELVGGVPEPADQEIATMTSEEVEAEFTMYVGFLLEQWIELGRYQRATPLGVIVDELELERAAAVDRKHNEGRDAARRVTREAHARRGTVDDRLDRVRDVQGG